MDRHYKTICHSPNESRLLVHQQTTYTDIRGQVAGGNIDWSDDIKLGCQDLSILGGDKRGSKI